MKTKPTISTARKNELKNVIKDLSSMNDYFNHGFKMERIEKFITRLYENDETFSIATVPVMMVSYGMKGKKVVEGDEAEYAIVSLVEKYLEKDGFAFVGKNTKKGKSCFFYGKACYELAALMKEDVDTEPVDFRKNRVAYRGIPYELTDKRKIKAFGGERLGDVKLP